MNVIYWKWILFSPNILLKWRVRWILSRRKYIFYEKSIRKFCGKISVKIKFCDFLKSGGKDLWIFSVFSLDEKWFAGSTGFLNLNRRKQPVIRKVKFPRKSMRTRKCVLWKEKVLFLCVFHRRLHQSLEIWINWISRCCEKDKTSSGKDDSRLDSWQWIYTYSSWTVFVVLSIHIVCLLSWDGVSQILRDLLLARQLELNEWLTFDWFDCCQLIGWL